MARGLHIANPMPDSAADYLAPDNPELGLEGRCVAVDQLAERSGNAIAHLENDRVDFEAGVLPGSLKRFHLIPFVRDAMGEK